MKVAWSPVNKNKFFTYTTSVVNLYETKSLQGSPVPNGSVSLCEEFYATNVATLSDVHLLKWAEWYPGETNDPLIAIGLANGKVLISNFGLKGESDLIGKEFIPKHLRHCVYLAWNPVYPNLLVEGLDKHRNDCCVYIWDVNMRTANDLQGYNERQRYSSNLSDTAVTKPHLELGIGDTTSSLAWFSKEPRTFVTGMNGKQLRVYDLRDVSKPHLVAHTKFVNGVCTDPLHDSRLATYCENHVSVWDVRQFEKPILTIPADRGLLKIDWCPTRAGFLAVLCRESSVVKLYDVHHSVIGSDDLEPVIFDRTLQPNKQHAVTSFGWQPKCGNRITTVSPTGQLKDNKIFDKLPLSVNPMLNMSWMFERRMNVQDYTDEPAMSTKIRQRALQGYGLHQESLWNNAVVVADEPRLHALWHWLDLSTKLLKKEDAPKKPQKLSRFIGVLDLLNIEHQDRPVTDMVHTTWQYPDGYHSNSRDRKQVCQYRSEARYQALQLCGWWQDTTGHDTNDALSLLLESLVVENYEYERAAAIALFNLKIGKAVEILSCDAIKGESAVLNMVAMALSGFTEERNAMWRQTCSDLRLTLKNPYLRAMFAFLAGDRESFDDVLRDDIPMAVKDRVAFACMYLNDTKLWNYLKDLSKHLKQTGDLDGILLTGLTNEEGLELLSKYVDITSDVQTVSLAIMYSSPSDLFLKDARVQTWVESYRDLLNRWKLWHQRAKFDIIRHSIDKVRVQCQAFVSCNFCGKSVACNMTLTSRARSSNYSSLPPNNRPKITCCPGCRKPLPRCALCCTHLGTLSGSACGIFKDKSEYESKLSSFDSWFTWCQTCRHGGHSQHIIDWFKEHVECPVTGCQCRCMIVDPSSKLRPESVTALSDPPLA